MDDAIRQLDDALASYLSAEGMDDAQQCAAEKLSAAAENVLNNWDFDRGIPKP